MKPSASRGTRIIDSPRGARALAGAADDQGVARLVRERAPHLGAATTHSSPSRRARRLQSAATSDPASGSDIAIASVPPVTTARTGRASALGAEAVERADHDERHSVGADRDACRARSPRGTAWRRRRPRPSRRTPPGSGARTSRARHPGRHLVVVAVALGASNCSREAKSRIASTKSPAARPLSAVHCSGATR